MRLPRFSIAGLMGLVVVAAVGVAALRFASELWAGVLLLLTLGVLGAAILGAVHRRDGKRAWWQGFALFGWGYLTLALGPWFGATIAPSLPTTAGLTALYSKMHPASEARGDAVARAGGWVSSSDAVWVSTATPAGVPAPSGGLTRLALFVANPPSESFLRVGHCLWALLAACVGGLIGRAFHAREAR